jgi:hypothetical protein
MEKKRAILLGLHWTSADFARVKADQAAGVEVWTMNDFWLWYPMFKPDAIFQIHRPEWLPVGQNGRWLGNWRTVYNAAACPVYTCFDNGLDNERLLDEEVLYCRFPRYLYQCTVVYMLAVAMDTGIEVVRFDGMLFADDGERTYQLPYIVEAIRLARANGLTVDIDPEIEEQWSDVLAGMVINWKELMTVEPYHARESNAGCVKIELKPEQLDIN